MKKNYYLFNPGRLSRKDNTLKFVQENSNERARYVPIENIQDLYVFGSLDSNSALYNFLGKHQVAVHFFDYYEHYRGSFMPKEYLLAGKMQLEQSKHFLSKPKRLFLAQAFVSGSAQNILKNLQYYSRRNKPTELAIQKIEEYIATLPNYTAINELMGLEGNIRQTYYAAFDAIINDFTMGTRTKQPPLNEVNTLISFGNMMCYSVCLSQLYHTQLNPTISFLHEPGYRRYSLALDLAEIFKPLLVDRTIFSLLNKKQLNSNDFRIDINKCVLKDRGKRVFVEEFEKKLSETIKHRQLGRSVSYKHLIKLECYKLSKHLLNIEPYKPFKAWW